MPWVRGCDPRASCLFDDINKDKTPWDRGCFCHYLKCKDPWERGHVIVFILNSFPRNEEFNALD